MGKAKRIKVTKSGRTEGLEQQISREEQAKNKRRIKVLKYFKSPYELFRLFV